MVLKKMKQWYQSTQQPSLDFVIYGTPLPQKYAKGNIYDLGEEGVVSLVYSGWSIHYAHVRLDGTLEEHFIGEDDTIVIDKKALMFPQECKGGQVIKADLCLYEGKAYIGTQPSLEERVLTKEDDVLEKRK